MLLLLLSGVEMNPGPVASAATRSQYASAKLSLGSLNIRICSAVNKTGCIRDITDSAFDLDLFLRYVRLESAMTTRLP